MAPDFVLKPVVTAASIEGTSIPFRRLLTLHSLGRLDGAKESHAQEAKKHVEASATLP